MARSQVNRLNFGIGLVGLAYAALFANYFVQSIGRDNLGNAGIAFLSLVGSGIPALGCIIALGGRDRPFMGWRVVALVLVGLLMAPLGMFWSSGR